MKKIMVALITPFFKKGCIDYKSLETIVLRLLGEGVDGFIVCGTTSEVSTLSHEERFQILNYVIKLCAHRCEIWFGCGSNNTQTTITLMKEAQNHEIDGYLIVTPYYNKPSQRGLFEHFSKIASHTKLPIMLYNVPARCGVTLSYEVIKALKDKHPNIYGLKQASKDYDCVKKMKQAYPDFVIYSGEDAYLKQAFQAGMDGIISVAGHLFLADIKAFIDAYENHQDTALTEATMVKNAQLCFCDASPAPIKYMLSLRGECRNVLRLPLTVVSRDKQKLIDEFNRSFDIS
ncbi:MAG: 4-hydroxy-tetrahydrodipicolinate synthase [Erysipelotrichaceae bacterium]